MWLSNPLKTKPWCVHLSKYWGTTRSLYSPHRNHLWGNLSQSGVWKGQIGRPSPWAVLCYYSAEILTMNVKKVSVSLSCPTLCDHMDCSPPGSSVHGFSGQEYWSGLPFPSPRDLPNPGTEPRSPVLEAEFFTVWATREAQYSLFDKDLVFISIHHE